LRRSFCDTLRGGGGICLYLIGGTVSAVIGEYMQMFEFILSPLHSSLFTKKLPPVRHWARGGGRVALEHIRRL
jgi:hypothetical protein